MARFQFGGVMAAWVVETVSADIDGSGTPSDVVTIPSTATTITIYDAPDGTPVTDLLDANSQPITEITMPAGDPYVPLFHGPDTIETLWVQASNGSWLPMPMRDVVDNIGEGQYLALTGANSYTYPDSQQEPYIKVEVPNDGSASGSWKNRVEFWYEDQSTSQYRLGFYVNEKCLLRVRGVTPNDVAFRVMAHPDLDPQWPITETADNDNSVKFFQSFTHKTVSHVGMHVPYIVFPTGERLYGGSADPATDLLYASHRPNLGDMWLDPVNGDA